MEISCVVYQVTRPRMAAPAPTLRFKNHPVPGDGDCLFHSVVFMLQTLSSDSFRKLVSSLTNRPIRPDQPQELSRLLRFRVAARVLDEEDEDAKATIDVWQQLWADAVKEKSLDMMAEMGHLANVMQPASRVDRRILFSNMLNAKMYWGDEFALRTLERLMRCTFIVFDDSYKPVRRERTALGGRPLFVGLLLLRGMHYEPLYVTDGSAKRVLFRYEELPPVLRELLDRHAT